jgi:hemolysin D
VTNLPASLLGRPRRTRDERDFLPAALEIVETPPSPIGRAIGVTIIALFGLALAWASFGEVDIIAAAPGKIIPSGRTKVIQPFETGVVRAIHVRDGQSVKAGQVLIELDPTMNEAERNHLRSDLTSAQLDVARLRAALSGSDDPVSEFRPPAAAPPSLVVMQRQFLVSQTSEFAAKIAALDRQRAQKEAERATIAATIAKLDATIPILQERLNIRKGLADKELVSKIIYLETLHQRSISNRIIKSKRAAIRRPRRPWQRSSKRARRPRRSSVGRYRATWRRLNARWQVSART